MAARMFQTENSSILDVILRRVNSKLNKNYIEYKEEQKQVITNALKNDCVAILPTGFGKTLIIESLPFISDSEGTIVVISPLNAIIEEQQKRFGERCIFMTEGLRDQLTETGPHTQTVGRILDGYYHFIIGHPEVLTSEEMVKFVYRKMKKDIDYIVVDEAHCLLSWGKSKFRSDFLRIQSIRTTLVKAKVVALTATATPSSQEEIARLLRMEEPAITAISPDRPNVRIIVRKRICDSDEELSVEDTYDVVLKPIIQSVVDERIEKTVIFCKLKWCGYIHEEMCRALCSHFPGGLVSIVAQFHSPQTDDAKKLIMREFGNPDGSIKIVLASDAFGMGVDYKDVRNVIHASPPSDIEMFAQQLGRCGRDGGPATAILYFSNADLGVTHMTNVMREFCRTEECKRRFLLRYFGFETDNCMNCSSCLDDVEAKVALKPKRGIVAALLSYFNLENQLVDHPFPELKTGLSKILAKHLSCQPDIFIVPENVKLKYPHLKAEFCAGIASIIRALDVRDDDTETDEDTSSEIVSSDSDSDDSL